MANSYDQNKANAFYHSLIINNNLDNDKYFALLTSFGGHYQTFSFADIDEDKVMILVQLKIIRMNKNNLIFVRDNYPSCKMQYIASYVDIYAQEVIDAEEGIFQFDELEYLLRERATDKNLLRLLTYTDKPISIKEIIVSDAVKEHIIKNNFCGSDLSTLTLGYENESAAIKATILALCIKDIDSIIENNLQLPYSLLVELLHSKSASSKIELFATQLTNLNREHTKECFAILGMADWVSIFEGKRPVVEMNDMNASILRTMESKGWIASFSEDKDKGGFYRVWSRRNAKQSKELADHLL